jgi:crossover junction endodeoxyribonuclease RuvC
MNGFIVGIDPGLEGAIAIYDARTEPHLALTPPMPMAAVFDMPTTDPRRFEKKRVDGQKLAELMRELQKATQGQPLEVVVEKVQSLPRQAGGFNFGLDTGTVHGVLQALGIPFTLVTPAVWKPAMGLQRPPEEPKEQNKARARALATKLFPGLQHYFKRVRDDGRAEALLLALYFANR